MVSVKRYVEMVDIHISLQVNVRLWAVIQAQRLT